MSEDSITIKKESLMSFRTKPQIILGLCAAIVLSACGEEPPVIVTDQPVPEKVENLEPKKPVLQSQEVETAIAAETETKPRIPTLEITASSVDDKNQNDPAASEREQTIQSIINQLRLRDEEDNKTANLDENRSEALTSERLKSSDIETSDKVIWTIDSSDQKEEQPEPIIPEGRDPSLATEALAAAFALVRDHSEVSDQFIQEEGTPIEVISKPEGGIRAAVLAPLQGRAASIGEEMQLGAELAIFTLGNPKNDLTFHDTSSGINKAMNAAMLQNPDIIIGPLFAENTKAAKPIAQLADVPILSFSNDSVAAGQNAWLIGQTPEQEIAAVLQYALETVTPLEDADRDLLSIGLVVQDNIYGKRISTEAIDILTANGGVTAEMLTLNQDVLNDENTLRQSVKNLTKWLPPSSEGETRPPRFDIVIIAGDVSFALSVAPVLSWYDLDPTKVKYLGTSGWSAPAILQEPSLNQGWFASQPAAPAEQFQSLWSVTNQGRASKYAMMAFDAVALVSTLSPDDPQGMSAALTNGPGFNGFSGAFKLAPSGQNIRQLEIRQITDGRFDVLVPAKTSFD